MLRGGESTNKSQKQRETSRLTPKRGWANLFWCVLCTVVNCRNVPWGHESTTVLDALHDCSTQHVKKMAD